MTQEVYLKIDAVLPLPVLKVATCETAIRNIVCLCQRPHGYFKQQNGALYWDLIRKHIGEERWAWLQRMIADRKTYPMGIFEWQKVELALKQELNVLAA